MLVDDLISVKNNSAEKTISKLNPEIEEAVKMKVPKEENESMMVEELTDKAALSFLRKLNHKIAKLSAYN